MRSHGYRRGTRKLFSQDHRKRGVIHTKKYLEDYKVGQYVDIVTNPAVMKGMPYKYYHGRTGQIFDIRPRSVRIALYKRVGGKYAIKTVCVRIEHIRKSKCTEDYENRVSNNHPKRVPEGPRKAMHISLEGNQSVTVGYEYCLDAFQ